MKPQSRTSWISGGSQTGRSGPRAPEWIPRACRALLLLCALPWCGALNAEGAGRYTYVSRGGSYPYLVRKTGENFSFEFDRSPEGQPEKLAAATHVLLTVYDEMTVTPMPDRFFMKETAKCHVFEGNWYTYTACILPNDYSPENQNRFWGFVYSVPNSRWLLTRNLLPALGLLGFAWFGLRRPAELRRA